MNYFLRWLKSAIMGTLIFIFCFWLIKYSEETSVLLGIMTYFFMMLEQQFEGLKKIKRRIDIL